MRQDGMKGSLKEDKQTDFVLHLRATSRFSMYFIKQFTMDASPSPKEVASRPPQNCGDPDR